MASIDPRKSIFTIIFQRGGELNATWHQTLLRGTEDDMRIEQWKQFREGRNAYVKSLWDIEVIGMPEGFREAPVSPEQASRHLQRIGVP